MSTENPAKTAQQIRDLTSMLSLGMLGAPGSRYDSEARASLQELRQKYFEQTGSWQVQS